MIQRYSKLLIFKKNKVRREANYALCNACAGSNLSQVDVLINLGFMRILCDQLKSTEETRVLKVCLEALENLLHLSKDVLTYHSETSPYLQKWAELGGYSVIEALQTHPDQLIYKIVEQIIDKYFETT
jgi:Mg2+ and Co2+ transporter CorA